MIPIHEYQELMRAHLNLARTCEREVVCQRVAETLLWEIAVFIADEYGSRTAFDALAHAGDNILDRAARPPVATQERSNG